MRESLRETRWRNGAQSSCAQSSSGPPIADLAGGRTGASLEDDPIVAVRENFVACDVRSYSASWKIHAFCSPANASRCVQEIRSASTRLQMDARDIEMSASDLATRAISANRAK